MGIYGTGVALQPPTASWDVVTLFNERVEPLGILKDKIRISISGDLLFSWLQKQPVFPFPA